MKKIYFMAVFLGASSFAFNQAQIVPLQMQDLSTEVAKTVPTNYIPTKALGASIWSDNFDDPNTWVMDNDGQTDPMTGWDINSSVDGWYFADPIAAPSAGNFAEVGNGDAGTASTVLPMNVTYTLTTASPISISTTALNLEFLQYGARFNDSQKFQVSADGVTFVTVGSNDSRAPLVQGGGSAYDNPELVMAHLKDYLPNGATQVWVRFQWTSKFPSETTNQNAWVTYGWMIDNVSISTLADNDLQAESKIVMGSNPDTLVYYQIPLAQVAPIKGFGTIKNVGSADQTNVKFKANETIAGVYSSESDPSTVLAGETKDFALNSDFTPTAMGSYKIDYSIEADDVDDVMANNTFNSYAFTVGDSVYARDNSTDAESGNFSNSLPTTGGISGGGVIKKYAIAYDIVEDTKLTSISYQLGNMAKAGQSVAVQIFSFSGNDPVFLDEGELYTVVAGDKGSFHTGMFANPVTLTAGKTYFAGVEMYGDSLSVAYAGTVSRQTSAFQTTDDVWSFFGNGNPGYVIRMNVDKFAGVNSNELSNLEVTQFPNPFVNETTVRFSLEEASNVSYTITDMTGKVISDVNKGNLNSGNHEFSVNGSSLASGIYYLNLKTDNAQVTRKMVVNK